MANEIDFSKDDVSVLQVGKLNSTVINLLGLSNSETSILFGKDRLFHIEKHRHKFNNSDDFMNHVKRIPEIIQFPDYVGIHPDSQSIEYIKRLDHIVLVAIRVRLQGNLWVKTMYPITEHKIKQYEEAGRVKEYK